MRGAGNKAGPLARVTLGLLAAVLVGCATLSGAPDASDSSAREGYLPVDQLQIVDCLLPGQIRKLGSMVYKTQRRPIRTTAADCEIRGGEYVAYDRADYRSALHVWLARAKAGKAKAQNYVGEIFEKGLGRTPDYVSAAAWYRRAAEQGDARAQINLGFLYEKGLGVEKDVTKALYWYRKASGLTPDDDQIVWKSSNDQERRKLENQLATARQQVAVLQGQIDQMQAARGKLQNKLEQARKAGSGSSGRAEALQAQLTQAQTQIATLAQLAQRARQERRSLDNQLETMPAAGSQPASSAKAPTVAANNQKRDTQVRSISEADSESQNRSPQPAVATQAKPLSARGVKFGKYYALIIGNQDYKYLDDLKTPLGDAHKLQQVLEKKYGFRTFLVADGSKVAILNALNDLYEVVGENDNLLVYYAGHGELSHPSELERVRGYWLPVNAQPDILTRWINNSVISDHLDRIRARSILVLADSCYAGAMASLQSALLLASGSSSLSTQAIERGISRRSRIVISSGGVAPVYDTGAKGTHSLFTGALLEVLEHNDAVLRDNMLFARVAVDVHGRAKKLGVSQTPQMRPIRAAGHAGGDFFFVPTSVKDVATR